MTAQLTALTAGDAPTIVDVSGLADRVAAAYVDALRQQASPLVASESMAKQREQRAVQIVGDVLATLGHGASRSDGPSPWPVVRELRSGACCPSAAIDGSDMLFAVAFRALMKALPNDPVDIAASLTRRLSADLKIVAKALAETNVLDLATTEIVDHVQLRRVLSPQQITVFELKRRGSTTEEIAAALCISPKTVKNHVTDIGRRLDIAGEGRTWEAVQYRARELGMLIVVPVVAAAASLTDIAATIGSLL